MRAKKQSSQKADSAGFDYYLKRLEERREETRQVVQLDLLRLLARNQGEMRMFDMASDHLGSQVTGDDLMDFIEEIKKMQASYLIRVLSAEGESSEGESSEGIENLRIRLTGIGKRALEAEIGLPIDVKSM